MKRSNDDDGDDDIGIGGRVKKRRRHKDDSGSTAANAAINYSTTAISARRGGGGKRNKSNKSNKSNNKMQRQRQNLLQEKKSAAGAISSNTSHMSMNMNTVITLPIRRSTWKFDEKWWNNDETLIANQQQKGGATTTTAATKWHAYEQYIAEHSPRLAITFAQKLQYAKSSTAVVHLKECEEGQDKLHHQRDGVIGCIDEAVRELTNLLCDAAEASLGRLCQPSHRNNDSSKLVLKFLNKGIDGERVVTAVAPAQLLSVKAAAIQEANLIELLKHTFPSDRHHDFEIETSESCCHRHAAAFDVKKHSAAVNNDQQKQHINNKKKKAATPTIVQQLKDNIKQQLNKRKLLYQLKEEIVADARSSKHNNKMAENNSSNNNLLLEQQLNLHLFHKLHQMIRSLKLNVAPGPDGISNRMIQHAVKANPHDMLYILGTIISHCLAYGYHPAEWKLSEAAFRYKGGVVNSSLSIPPPPDPMLPSSYRPLVFPSNLAKLLERVVRDIIEEEYLLCCNYYSNTTEEDNHHVNVAQYGFQRNVSVTDARQAIRDAIDRYSNNSDNKVVALISFDISRAFDAVWWPSVIVAMKLRANLPSHLINYVDNYLSNRTVVANYGNINTVKRAITRGIPQGSCLSPTLWKLCFSSLLQQLALMANDDDDGDDELINTNSNQQQEQYTTTTPKFIPVAYADDLVVVCGAKYTNNSLADTIRRVLTCVQNWCIANKLNINVQKTAILPIQLPALSSSNSISSSSWTTQQAEWWRKVNDQVITKGFWVYKQCDSNCCCSGNSGSNNNNITMFGCFKGHRIQVVDKKKILGTTFFTATTCTI